MPSVRRHIHIAAPVETVRHYLDDPALRRGWLDEDVDLVPTEDGGRHYVDRNGEVERHVHIEVQPDGDGARVSVTESLGEPDDSTGSVEPGSVEPLSDDEVVALDDWRERRASDELGGDAETDHRGPWLMAA